MAAMDASEQRAVKDHNEEATEESDRAPPGAASRGIMESAALATTASKEEGGQQQMPLAAGSVAAAVLLASRSIAERLCAVCGDEALAINFGVITCESCKAFFRRNAAKEEQLKCVFSGQCLISINTRHFCTACRLKRCFSVGMKKELILGEDELRRRRELTAQHRQARLLRQQQRLGVPEVSGDEPPSAAATTATDSRSLDERSSARGSLRSADEVPFHEATDLLWQNLGGQATGQHPEAAMALEMAEAGRGAAAAAQAADDDDCRRSHPGEQRGQPRQQQPLPQLRGSGCVATDLPQQQGKDAGLQPPPESVPVLGGAARPAREDSPDPGVTAEPAFTMGHFDPADSSSYMSPSSLARRSLSSADEATMDVLRQAYCTTIGMVTESESKSILAINDLESGINRTRVIVQKLIGFARCVTEFTASPMLVQMALLKQAALPCITLRSAQLYDPNSSMWNYGDGCKQVSFDALGGLLSPSFNNEHGVLVSSIRRLVPTDAATGQCDLGIFALLLVIALLSPEYVLSSADCVQEVAAQLSDAQQHYIMLLSRYLQMRYSFAHAAVLLPALLNCITMCKQVALSMAVVLRCCDRTRIDPLLQEVYELDRPVAPADR